MYAMEYLNISDNVIKNAHQSLAKYFAGRSDSGFTTLLSDSMEAYHHGLEGGGLNKVAPLFTDQLNAFGRMLSLNGKHDQAAEVFEQSMQWDDEDDYAHHYYAYNLDYVGKKSAVVDQNYRIATEIDPKSTWWWSRRINFLITIGRVAAAKAAWEEARFQLAPRQDAEYYAGLHRWVARLAIEVGHLDFAESILGDVPETGRHQPYFRALTNYLSDMRCAQARRAVFPLGVDPETKWAGPQLNQLVNDFGESLIRWIPGRVDECDTEHVLLTVATPPASRDAEPIYGTLSMKQQEFERAWKHEPNDSLAAGRYIEIAYYLDEKDPRSERLLIRAHPDEEWDEKNLPSIDPPDTARYLRQRGLLT
jgi:hypothetical protein